MNKLTREQLSTARWLARRDYEVRTLLHGYEAEALDDEGFDLLLEEISYAPSLRVQAAHDLAEEFGSDVSEWLV